MYVSSTSLYISTIDTPLNNSRMKRADRFRGVVFGEEERAASDFQGIRGEEKTVSVTHVALKQLTMQSRVIFLDTLFRKKQILCCMSLHYAHTLSTAGASTEPPPPRSTDRYWRASATRR